METATIQTTQFARKLMDPEESELLSRHLKRLKERMEDDGILLRRLAATIKGWLSPAYNRMDAAPIVETFLKHTVQTEIQIGPYWSLVSGPPCLYNSFSLFSNIFFLILRCP